MAHKKVTRWTMILKLVLLAGLAVGLPTQTSEENDGEVSRKILGSSVVTSVSVIMDIGNGSKTYFSDAAGKPMTKPTTATQLASPINLLNPDRYEFYTFDDSGDLVKRLMTLDEIQGIIASGDGEATNYNSQSLIGDEPEKKVDDVVNNVQNVLKEEMEAHKTPPPLPIIDVLNLTSNWNMILPAVFGNVNDNILPDKQNSAIAETIVLEDTTTLPQINDTLMRTEIPSSETDKLNETVMTTDSILSSNTKHSYSSTTMVLNTSKDETESTTEITSFSEVADNKIETSFLNEVKLTPNTESNFKTSSTRIYSRPVITISSPAPFSTRPTSIPSTSTKQAIHYTTKDTATPSSNLQTVKLTETPVEISSVQLPTAALFKSTNTPLLSSSTPIPSIQHGLLSTFFLIEDSKHKEETTTKQFSSTSPFTYFKIPITDDKTTEFKHKIETTIKPTSTPSSVTSSKISTTEYTTKQTPTSTTTTSPITMKPTESINSKISTSSPTERYTIQEITEENLSATEKLTSTPQDILLESTTIPYGSFEDNQEPVKRNLTTESEDQTIFNEAESNLTTIPAEFDKLPVTELLQQLFLTTNAYQINSELLSGNTENNNEYTTEPNVQQITLTSKPENVSDIISTIEQIISEAPLQNVESVNNEKDVIQITIDNSSSPMSEVQAETATAASALIGNINADTSSFSDAGINEAVDSLISQIMYQPSKTTIEDYLAAVNKNKDFTTISSITTPETVTEQVTILNVSGINDLNNANEQESIDDKNRYEEIDLGSIPLTTIKYESKTIQSLQFLNNINTDYHHILSEKNTSTSEGLLQNKITTSGELTQEETQFPLQTETTTDRAIDNSITTETESNNYFTTASNPTTTDESSEYNKQTSTEYIRYSTGTTNQILNTETLEFNEDNYNKTSTPFTIVTTSTEYPDPTKNVQLYTQTLESADTITTTPTTDVSTEKYQTENYPTEYNSFTDQTTSNNILWESFASTQNNFIDENTDTVNENTEAVNENITSSNYISVSNTGEYDSTMTTEEAQKITTSRVNFTSPTQESLISSTNSMFSNLIASTQEAEDNLSSTELPNLTSSINPTQDYETIPTQEPFSNSLSTEQSDPTLTTVLTSTPSFVNLPIVTVTSKIDKLPDFKIVPNITVLPTPKPEMTWTLVSTVAPHKLSSPIDEPKTPLPNRQEPTSVELVPKPLQGFGLEDSTSALDTDVYQFTELCNELAFSFWNSVTNGISFARSLIVSPFAVTSMLAMVFLGARGSTSGEMNDILKLDDMVTFNPHSIFKNVIDSIEISKKSGVAVSVFVKELYSDKNKGKLLSFYKERVKQFYDGHVEEVNFREINDVIRRRTNLLVKRQTWGKIQEYLKENNIFVRPPLAAVSANIFQTDCSEASTEKRDGELHFVVLPSIRQRKLVPIPAVVWRSGFLAGYDPGLDATAVSIGTKDHTVSVIFVMPGQQGISAPGDGLVRLETRLIESAFRQGGWSRLLRSLIPRPGLEVQIPRFSHKSVINATVALQRMGLKDLFNSNTADLKGLNGVAHEFYLSDIIQINTFATCGEGRIDETHHSEIYPATTNRSFRRIRKIHQYYQNEKQAENGDVIGEPRDYQRAFHDPLYDPNLLSLPLQLRPRQARLPDAPRLRFDRPFLYFVRHNPTGLILHMGRFNPRLLP